ncbi:MAG: hypothetical protein H0X31_00010 [Nostocaceae cyanobacterium]|nr:hypothetical protein [Nostocaceae cyanobacterium]
MALHRTINSLGQAKLAKKLAKLAELEADDRVRESGGGAVIYPRFSQVPKYTVS